MLIKYNDGESVLNLDHVIRFDIQRLLGGSGWKASLVAICSNEREVTLHHYKSMEDAKKELEQIYEIYQYPGGNPSIDTRCYEIRNNLESCSSTNLF